MGKFITLKARDGASLSAYSAEPPSGEAKGGVLILQEIFGVTRHIQDVCDYYAAAVSYYGGDLPTLKYQTPRCPVLAHFGRLDASIPVEGVEAFMATQPNVECYLYNAGHGFNCGHRPQYDAVSAKLARARTDAFLAQSPVQSLGL